MLPECLLQDTLLSAVLPPLHPCGPAQAYLWKASAAARRVLHPPFPFLPWFLPMKCPCCIPAALLLTWCVLRGTGVPGASHVAETLGSGYEEYMRSELAQPSPGERSLGEGMNEVCKRRCPSPSAHWAAPRTHLLNRRRLFIPFGGPIHSPFAFHICAGHSHANLSHAVSSYPIPSHQIMCHTLQHIASDCITIKDGHPTRRGSPRASLGEPRRASLQKAPKPR